MADRSATRETEAMSGSDASSPLEEAVARVGDRWSLLVVHRLLDGPRRFNELLEGLPGLAPNILAKRLRTLEHSGVILAVPYSRHPPRFDYRLTAGGAELASALRLLAQWGANRAPEAEALHHASCGTSLEARWFCPTCGRVVDDDDVDHLHFA